MYRRLIRNDMMKSKVITMTTMIFVAAAAMLVSLAAILAVNLTGAIDTLMTQAKTPHFLQMHSGSLDSDRLAAFAGKNNNVDQYQAVEFLNMDGSQIVIDGSSLAGSVQDNGITTQSKQFDYLLDLDGKVIEAFDGEIYVPVNYMKDGTAKLGDRAVISGKQLTVAGFLRDSQMNSLLASSKRFLVSEHDYAALSGSGSIEYLIEFRLKDLSGLGAFETAYTAAGLEANGPVITYSLFRMLNAISDGLMIAVILLVGALVVAVAFMCIRFTLLAKMEEDYREIGVMKAIGLRLSDIKRMYLAKYAVIAAAGCVLGYVLSLVFKGLLLENIRLYMGESGNTGLAFTLGIIGVLLVFLAILTYVHRVLRRFGHISVAEALRFGVSQDRSAGAKRLRLSGNRLLGTNLFLGIKDVLSRKRLYGTMLAVLVLSAFIIIVPQNLYNTISSEGFTAYMGIGKSDLRMDIQQTGDISAKTADIAKAMDSDSAISRYVVLTTKTFHVKTDNGTEERVKVELGDHSIFPVHYAKGRAPATESEIAISSLNANELGKKVGDSLTLLVQGKERRLTVSGIYSDVTNGGKTAKAVFTDHSADIMWSVVSAEIGDKAVVSGKVAEYADRFSYAKVSDIDEFINQTFGSTIRSVGLASNTAIIVALVIMVLVTLLFIRMLVAKDLYAIAVMKALGFTNSDIKAQYATRSLFVLVIGVGLGLLLANTLGEILAGAVVSSLGASSFTFEVNPLSAYVLSPLMMAGTVLIATIIGTSGAGEVRIAGHIKE